MLLDSLLSIITFVPLIGAAILALFLRGDDAPARRNAKCVALAATCTSLLASFILLATFDPEETRFQFVEEGEWILGLTYKMGVDG
ncbi:MAG: NADH-quinone oxidoreductase subunit M, partial [Boseongicola sp.]|nr:NADH-quinone oxidoreductase subunit M [Boseongicola sp.]